MRQKRFEMICKAYGETSLLSVLNGTEMAENLSKTFRGSEEYYRYERFSELFGSGRRLNLRLLSRDTEY